MCNLLGTGSFKSVSYLIEQYSIFDILESCLKNYWKENEIILAILETVLNILAKVDDNENLKKYFSIIEQNNLFKDILSLINHKNLAISNKALIIIDCIAKT